MFLKILVSIFSILVLIKTLSYAKYEYKTNSNIFGAVCITILSLISTFALNFALFLIRF